MRQSTYLKALSHLDDLANVCLTYENLAKMLAHVEYVMGKFVYVKSTMSYVVVGRAVRQIFHA